MCMLPKEKGPCMAKEERYFFDTSSGRCVKFIFGGCYGNENNFESLGECESTCHSLIQSVSNSKPVSINMGKSFIYQLRHNFMVVFKAKLN